ncbi:hypothetical protein GCM10010400_21440 [Streptomyces aculeolatus]
MNAFDDELNVVRRRVAFAGFGGPRESRCRQRQTGHACGKSEAAEEGTASVEKGCGSVFGHAGSLDAPGGDNAAGRGAPVHRRVLPGADRVTAWDRYAPVFKPV